MKRVVRFFAMAVMVCGFAYAFTACDQQEEFEEPAQEVVFSAATAYDNLPETRTEYSGDFLNVNGQNIERINWKNDNSDKIRVLNVTTGQAATYTVGTPSVQGTIKSVAGVTADAAKITWGPGATNTFYAVYPDGAMNASNQIGATIGADQSNQNESHPGVTLPNQPAAGQYTNPAMNDFAFMVAKVENAPNGSNVTLPFVPAMTAFEFKVGIANDGGSKSTVTKFEMTSTSTALTGAWTWDGSAFSCPAHSNSNNKITVNFTSPNNQSTSSNPLKFTVFALPQTLRDVTLTFTLGNGTTKSLTFPASQTFIGGKKYRITTPGLPTDGDWVYRIEEINDITTYGHLAVNSNVGVVSYRYREENGSPVPGTYEAVAWKSQYWDGSQWQDWSSAYGDFSLGSSYTGNGVSDITTNEPRTVSLVDNTNYTSTGHHSSTYILQHRNPVSNYSLCDHDLYGNSISSSTANTYVVTTSGTYNFPGVYGNGIKKGSINHAAYSGGNFRNAINAGIQSCWIYDDLVNHYGWRIDSDVCAEVVWQDEENLISTQPTVQFIGGNYWINFEIKQNQIKPGNAVIALKATIRSSDNSVVLSNAILWSWQIWITDQDLSPTDNMMKYNLGWNVDGDVQEIQYTNRELPIRIQQIAPSDDLNGAIDNEDFTFTQLADAAELYELAIGSNPYYQWGRKDPMLPGMYSPVPNERGDYCVDKPFYPGANYASMSSETQDPGSTKTYAEYGPGIREPYVGLRNEWSTGWIGGDHNVVGNVNVAPYNLWDSNITSANALGSGDSGNSKIKTVYDPCPVGFTVPVQSKFNSYVQNSTLTDGGRNFSSGLFMPYSGARIFYNRVAWGQYDADNPGPIIPAALYLRHVNEFGLYWTDTPYQDNRFAQIFIFDVSSVTRIAYTRGTAAAIRPMVDPGHTLTVPQNYPPTAPSSSSSLNRGNGSIQPVGNGGEIPAN